MELVYIYSLVDPRDNQIKYIGKANDLGVRSTAIKKGCLAYGFFWKSK